MRVVEVPATLDYRSLDELAELVRELGDGRILLDARRLRWIDPVGMIGMLTVGRSLHSATGHLPALRPPDSVEVSGYLSRMGFFDRAREVFELASAAPRRVAGASDVLLELSAISENHDVHDVVERVQERAGHILSRTLHYPPSAVVQFAVILSEVCQNILEHAEAPGWVAAQSYNWSKRLGRHVLILAVGDTGRGFRSSLEGEHAGRFGARWGDATALEAAFLHGLTRFPDQGRGQGIQQMRRQVRRWDGVISVRSGTARIADVPDWEDLPPLEADLAPFPGAQITILLPERLEEDR
jgi:hypothetical protein